jgi:prepilin-type N-terminal cleavage/methylation domain-containing protein
MKRSGFTMIELIFVIVILGILAAVAIPKLAATRDDAKIAKGATEIATVVSDFGAYYTAQGSFGLGTEMTNVTLKNGGLDFNTSSYFYVADTAKGDCIELNTTTLAAADGNFTVSYEGVDTSAVCQGIANAAAKVTGGTASATGVTHSFGGSSVNWN